MQHLGEILRTCIRDKGLKQKEIADKAGITAAYLVNILKKKSIDCELWERLCEATGIDPIVAFSPGGSASTYISGVSAATVIGQASVNIGSDVETLKALLAEKERTIQILMAKSGLNYAPKT